LAFRLLVGTQKQAGADEAGESPQQPLTDPQATSELGLVPFLNLFQRHNIQVLIEASLELAGESKERPFTTHCRCRTTDFIVISL
jgi:hypothetical protein